MDANAYPATPKWIAQNTIHVWEQGSETLLKNTGLAKAWHLLEINIILNRQNAVYAKIKPASSSFQAFRNNKQKHQEMNDRKGHNEDRKKEMMK